MVGEGVGKDGERKGTNDKIEADRKGTKDKTGENQDYVIKTNKHK